MNAARSQLVTLGRVVGLHGVRGGVKIVSHTRPRENILDYRQWWLCVADGEWRVYDVKNGRPQGKGLVAELAQVEDRDRARDLMGADIAVERGALPALPDGEYYWCDLLGLEVRQNAGGTLGRVVALEETGANDVLVVDDGTGRERLIPYVRDHSIVAIDLQAGLITVDWPDEAE